jgi:hypothetical protein
MTTLREAAQQAEAVLRGCLEHPDAADAIAALHAALAEPDHFRGVTKMVAEPVAWMSPGKERLEFARKDTVYGSHTIPLYTAPQPRKRLDVHEILDLMPEGVPARYDGELIAFCRAIEAAVWGDGK